MAAIAAKSKAGDPKAYVWMMLDVGGKMQAVCYAAKNANDALSVPFMLKATKAAVGAFRRHGGPKTVSSGLVDLGGRALTLPPEG